MDCKWNLTWYVNFTCNNFFLLLSFPPFFSSCTQLPLSLLLCLCIKYRLINLLEVLWSMQLDCLGYLPRFSCYCHSDWPVHLPVMVPMKNWMKKQQKDLGKVFFLAKTNWTDAHVCGSELRPFHTNTSVTLQFEYFMCSVGAPGNKFSVCKNMQRIITFLYISIYIFSILLFPLFSFSPLIQLSEYARIEINFH